MRARIAKIRRVAPRTLAAWLIRVYQWTISPMLGPRCRFHPTCSQYTLEAIEGYGLAWGTWLALKRLARCHPFHPGGFDPCPSPVGATAQREPYAGASGDGREHEGGARRLVERFIRKGHSIVD